VARRRRQTDTLALTAQYRPNWLDESDRRRADVRSVMSARAALVNDLGGEQAISTQRFMVIDRVIFLCLRLTELERRVLEGEEIDWNHYGHISNCLTGHLKTLGLDRKVKDVGTLEQYMEAAE